MDVSRVSFLFTRSLLSSLPVLSPLSESVPAYRFQIFRATSLFLVFSACAARPSAPLVSSVSAVPCPLPDALSSLPSLPLASLLRSPPLSLSLSLARSRPCARPPPPRSAAPPSRPSAVSWSSSKHERQQRGGSVRAPPQERAARYAERAQPARPPTPAPPRHVPRKRAGKKHPQQARSSAMAGVAEHVLGDLLPPPPLPHRAAKESRRRLLRRPGRRRQHLRVGNPHHGPARHVLVRTQRRRQRRHAETRAPR